MLYITDRVFFIKGGLFRGVFTDIPGEISHTFPRVPVPDYYLDGCVMISPLQTNELYTNRMLSVTVLDEQFVDMLACHWLFGKTYRPSHATCYLEQWFRSEHRELPPNPNVFVQAMQRMSYDNWTATRVDVRAFEIKRREKLGLYRYFCKRAEQQTDRMKTRPGRDKSAWKNKFAEKAAALAQEFQFPTTK